MKGKPKQLIQGTVPKEWIDYNGHMNDAEYARAFSMSVEALMEQIGITEKFREQRQYTIYTLESHICYLDEMKLDEPFEIDMQIIDYDEKRIHVFYELYGENKKRAATSEQMLIGIDETEGKVRPFPEEIYNQLKAMAENHTVEQKPKEVGRTIGIK